MAAQQYRKKQKELKQQGELSIEENSVFCTAAPDWLFAGMFFIALAVPNLVFSGRSWFDTLHLLKWFVAMVPVGIIALVAGVNVLWKGAERTNFRLDPFAVIWMLFLLYVTIQPLWVDITSISTFYKEWFFLATLIAAYILSYNLFTDKRLFKAVLWGGSVNAAINVVFAELLIRSLNSGIPFILDVPGNYIGNTAQQEMFGLWMAMNVLNCIYLHLSFDEEGAKSGFVGKATFYGNLLLMGVNTWGLWSSTARGGILALFVGFVVLMIGIWRTQSADMLKRTIKLSGMIVLLLIAVLMLTGATGRSTALTSKLADIVKNPEKVGDRITIWQTSWEIFKEHPMGVGLGHYKWHYLEGQRALLKQDPDIEWQFTYWAHNEYLQWLCETGVIGAAALLFFGAWWVYYFMKAMVRREKVPIEVLWSCAMLFLLWFDAIFSRPFHRIENALWVSMAFAIANRSILPQTIRGFAIKREAVYKLFAAFMVGASLYGFYFLGGGMIGDRLLLSSYTTNNANAKIERIDEAARFLMQRDEALEQMGNLYIEWGRAAQDMNKYVMGIDDLYAAFNRRPTSQLLFKLYNILRPMNEKKILPDLESYIKPGLFDPKPEEVPASQ